MICPPCRERGHAQCREVARQMDATLPDIDRQGGQWCDCQHQAPGDPRP